MFPELCPRSREIALPAESRTCEGRPEEPALSDTAIPSWDATRLAASIADRSVSCVEVMEAYLDRVDALNPAANAIVSLRPRDELMAEARARDAEFDAGTPVGALHGFPQAIKDLSPCAGLPTSQGSPIFAGEIATADSIMVARMRAAGAIFVGKTNVPEFGFGSQTFNPVFGATVNPYDPSRTCGGSSGGAAVAVALGMLPVADGSDHGGSLRNPAAYNNVFGLRTTPGRVPLGTDEVFLPSLTVNGPIARTVPDLALLLSVQAGFDARTPGTIREDAAMFAGPIDPQIRGMRVGWLGDLGGTIPLEAGILDLCETALRVLEGLGAQVEPALPDFPLESVFQAWMKLRGWGVAAARGPLYADPAKRALMKADARWEVEQGQKLSAVDVAQASAVRSAWYGCLGRLFERFDVLVLPSAQVFPFPIETPYPSTIAGRTMDTYHRWMEVMIPFTMGGLPAISVPVGFGSAGLPMGMQIAGPSHAEMRVLRIAHAYDLATGWVKSRPPDPGRMTREGKDA